MRFLILTLLMLSTQAISFEIKGVVPGMTFEQLEKLTGDLLMCKDEKTPYFTCTYDFDHRNQNLIEALSTLAEAPARFWHFEFVEGRLKSVSIRIRNGDFQSVAFALVAKFGKPKIERSSVQTKAGVSYPQEILRWEDKETWLVASRYASDINTSEIVLSHKALAKIREKQLVDQAFQKKKDL